MAEVSWLDRRAVAMMRRPMVGVEAAFYETVGATAVASVLGPVFSSVSSSGRVLDVGCGGDALRRGTVGIDPSVGQLRRARRRGTPMALAAASADGLPFAAGVFDGVLSSCALKHWPVLVDGIAECARVLRPGGRLAVAEVDGGAPGSRDLQRFARLTRLPPVVRWGYGFLARRTFVPATPPPTVVADAMVATGGLVDVTWRRIDGLPFYVVEGVAR